jgi:uncharacterized protein YjbI with pentapeptide repeats
MQFGFLQILHLKTKGTTFMDCSLLAVDFMSADLTGSFFDNCDLYRAEFEKAIAKSRL